MWESYVLLGGSELSHVLPSPSAIIIHNLQCIIISSTMPRLHHALIAATVLALLSNAAVVAWSPPSSSGFLTQYRRRIATTTRLASSSEDDSLADDDDVDVVESKHSGYNVLGTELECCCSDVGGSGIGTGFYRNGYCGMFCFSHIISYSM